jgi:release factor glutamine methyltransferase
MKPNAWLPMRSTPIEISAWIKAAKIKLGADDVDAGLDVQTVLAFVLDRPRSWVLAHPEFRLNADQIAQAGLWVERLVKGEPLAYLTGKREFFGLDFTITPHVLVPRPETELLVELALGWLCAHPDRRRAIDVGTGSGCIAAALTYHVPDLQVTAVDFSRAALRVARDNFKRLDLADRITLVQSDLLTGFGRRFDLICANLPYIPTDTLPTLPVSRYEPRLALDGGERGLDVIQRLIDCVHERLSPGGLLLSRNRGWAR